MNPLFFLLPAALIAWMLSSKNKAPLNAPALTPVPSGATRASLPASSSPSANTANYIQHVQNAIDAAQAMQDPLGTAGQFGPSLAMQTLDATAALSEPIDTLTAQKDLNFLGATPALVEDGIMGPKTQEAIQSFQTHAGLPATGVIDPSTATALRVAVATVASSPAS